MTDQQCTGVNTPRVSTRLKLLLLSDEQQQAVHEGRMTLEQAKLAGYKIKRRAPDKAPRPPRGAGASRRTGSTHPCPTCGGPMQTSGAPGQAPRMLVCGDCRLPFLPDRAEMLNKHTLSAHGRRATREERTPVAFGSDR